MEEKNYYNVPAISNSGMAYINPEQGGTPARYKKFIIDKDKSDESTPSLENGKLVHLYVENPAKFIISDVERPTEMLASWIEEVYEMNVFKLDELDGPFLSKDTEDRLEWAAHTTRKDRYKSVKDVDKLMSKFKEGLPYLMHLIKQTDELCITSKQKEIVEACVDSLKSNPVSKSLLFDPLENFGDIAHNELAIYWEEVIPINKETTVTLPCKALIDRLIIEPDAKRVTLIDLKTTSKQISKFSSTVEYYRYYRQLAWYVRATMQYLKQEYGKDKENDEWLNEWSVTSKIVAVETTGLHECFVFELSSSTITKGLGEAINLVSRIAFATETDNWTQPLEAVTSGGVILIDLKNESGEI